MTTRAVDLLRANRSASTRSLLAATAAAIAGGAWLGWLWMLASAIDRGFIEREALSAIATQLWGMGAVLVLLGGATLVASHFAESASAVLRTDLRQRLVAAVTAGDPRRLRGATVGRVSGTLTEGVESVGRWVSQYMPAAAMSVVLPLAAFAVVLVLDPLTTLILLFTGPMLVLLLAVIGRRTADLTRRRFDELGWLRGFYLDMLRGIGTLKSFGRSSDGAELIEDSSRRFGETTLEVLRTAFQTSLVMEWASTAATALVAVEVSFRMIRGDLSFGTALAVLVVTPEFFAPLRRLSLEYHVGRTGDAAASEVAEVLDSTPAGASVDLRTGGSRAATDPGTPPAIDFSAVTYRYPSTGRDVLKGLDLGLGAGETVALVGPSGAGKSTIASMLLRFVEPDSGRILVDGAALSDIDPTLWRRQVAWVPQSPTLFAGTVADNIALGRPDATPAQVRAAAQAAGAGEFIDALDGRYDTLLGESGLRLSGGQRQRIAIARAFLLDAPVVVFDEFTAHLDPLTESGVIEAAAQLFENRTALVIAHRERTRELADRVVQLESGRANSSRFDSSPSVDRP